MQGNLLVALAGALLLLGSLSSLSLPAGQLSAAWQPTVKLRRQAELAELAVNRLHILESLDSQLRRFADRASSAGRLSCALTLEPAGSSCLNSSYLKRRVPAYMLNLHRRLMSELRNSPPAAVRSLMPYKSQVVRSFAQPSLDLKEPSLLVELNTLARGEQVGREQADKPAGLDSGSGELASEEPTKECNLARQLCYWFHLGTRLRPHINGLRERLVEAELHAFKLLPLERQPDAANSSAGNLYQLKTNLLEVSVHQVLPRRSDQGGQLRLLDIRRIDLHSSGWETFYVKRALEDWIQEPRLNLGLVIKAKSMFDEPIRPSWIRFVDLRLGRAEQSRPSDFELAHQPILVVYTASANESRRRP